MQYSCGIDIGSTTVKIVVLDENDNILYKCYDRHLSKVRQKTIELLDVAKDIIGQGELKVTITGSAGLGVSKAAGLDFVQEVFVTGETVAKLFPKTDCVIELGGEDAKIIFFTGGLEERMNGSCAGGTGAFIDQMASLMDITVPQLDELSLKAEKIYTIASRCGVFAKSDIQPLLNQGARKEDIAASIFQAVVDQTITGLAQGRQIKGNILFLGGPLFFFKGLRRRFVETLELSEENAFFPDIAPYAIALGAAYYSRRGKQSHTFDELRGKLESAVGLSSVTNHLPPLFDNEREYEVFALRHSRATLAKSDIGKYAGKAYLGIDCGSTTTKLILLNDSNEIIYSHYCANKGNPVSVILEQLKIIYDLCADRIQISASAVIGYGEELIQNAFGVDFGLVETMAHFRAARYFNPKVDFILDIGGQDIKCFKIKNGAIDNIMLNEACSSGCGSFIETFAKGLGYDIETFCQLGLFAKTPIDLGSRCTVFMNSSVKQAQKDGASVGDISAGLSASVVKNALYKVIRVHNPDELGENIVVQGGTFLNDAILRTFEKETGRQVVRPAIAGLMGAFGAALYAREHSAQITENTKLLTREKLDSFKHESKSAQCGLCTNNCSITVNSFGEGRRYISGNKCERPLGIKVDSELPNMVAFKMNYFKDIAYKREKGKKYPNGKIGIPFGLGFFELLPFCRAMLEELGFEVVVSDVSSRALYRTGQGSIPSDTVCYPAKLIHGHIENLVAKGIKRIFYPCMTYNIDEGEGVNHYNCPVVAYYPELLKANMSVLADDTDVELIMPYLDITSKKHFFGQAQKAFAPIISGLDKKKLTKAIQAGFSAQDKYFADIKAEGEHAVRYAHEHNRDIVVLIGRPYHIDPEINHGIDKLIASFGLVIITEDIAGTMSEGSQRVNVLNQWTYHARLYNSARYAATHDNTQLVQLVSFGCGIDAITTDEVRDIMERAGKLYTQIKIDEINNLGAAKIRIRSMLEAAK